MGCNKHSDVRDDVDNARGKVIFGHVDIAFRGAYLLGRALESLDECPNQVKDSITPDQTV